MRQGSPAEAGYQVGEELPPIGKAARFRCARADRDDSDEQRAELWCLPEKATVLAERLASLGAIGIGGFVDCGRDDDGPWLVRVHEPSLKSWRKNNAGPIVWRECLPMMASLAELLAESEERSIFPGVIDDENVKVPPDRRCELGAESLIRGLVGDSSAAAKEKKRKARWMAPEERSEPNFASNRYALGLLLYQLLTDEFPFSGQGLRRGLSDKSDRGAPPLPEEVARNMPAGLQSYVLQLLAPAPTDRPMDARSIVRRLREFLQTDSRSGSKVQSREAAFKPGRTPEARITQGHRSDSSIPKNPRQKSLVAARLAALGILALGIAGAGLAMAKIRPTSSRSVEVSPRPTLHSPDSVSDCASCHPRQTSEWSRSVMAHSVKSPLFQSLEMLIEEQVGRSFNCPEGAGVLRKVDPSTACRNPIGGHAITGSGGEHWCVNCHSPTENLAESLPPWDGISVFSDSRRPLRDLLSAEKMEGIGCVFCHQVTGPVTKGAQRVGEYEGNPDWRSFVTGQVFSSRPEDRRGLFGIANSGYFLNPLGFLLRDPADPRAVPGGAHRRPDPDARAYLRSSEFCGSCHDVRLFGTDVIGSERGENFKRLRNAYSEWVQWSRQEEREGRVAASCQDCHMSSYPGVCELAPILDAAKSENDGCPEGSKFSPRAPGEYLTASTAAASFSRRVTTHYFSGVDIPLASEFPIDTIDDNTLDANGIPLGGIQRRNLLLQNTFELRIPGPKSFNDILEIPIEFENVGAGHRVPAGFSQEREVWVHMKVTDATGQLIYEVGKIGRDDEDLRDKIFLEVGTSDERTNFAGQPLGLFGADVIDGPDHPQWESTNSSDTAFRGQGLINLQNGFLRCVRCIGVIDRNGECQPGPGQGRHRADRFADGDYDIDTGECRSNLQGEAALFEVYFPVGSLDATRGTVRGPDAIVDSRSAPPNVPIRYVYEIDRLNSQGPYKVEARLMFRAFPPFLLRAFAAYEREQERKGRRPSGALLTTEVLERLEAVEMERIEVEFP